MGLLPAVSHGGVGEPVCAVRAIDLFFEVVDQCPAYTTYYDGGFALLGVDKAVDCFCKTKQGLLSHVSGRQILERRML